MRKRLETRPDLREALPWLAPVVIGLVWAVDAGEPMLTRALALGAVIWSLAMMFSIHTAWANRPFAPTVRGQAGLLVVALGPALYGGVVLTQIGAPPWGFLVFALGLATVVVTRMTRVARLTP